jgi:hypothetical protein
LPLAPPPRDAAGKVVPHDAADIAAGDGLIRRISEKQIVTDANGQRRISSISFKASSDGGMSIDLEAQIVEAGFDPRHFVTSPYWTGSVRLVTVDVRAAGLLVGSDPIAGNPYHGEVWGISTRAHQKRLQTLAVWYVPMANVLTAPA